jgi:hypothetical protein
VLTPELRDRFISEDSKSANRIRPYLGAEEMNESPDAGPVRWVIYMEGLDEDAAKKYPILYAHLSGTVRLQRQDSSEKRLRERWWLYSRPANELYSACNGMTHILASGRASTHLCFVFQSTNTIFSDALTCFIFERYNGFAILQSRIHERWARFFGSSLKDDPRYIPEDCFETFPLPSGYESDAKLQSQGQAYYQHRAQLMLQNNSGLTAIYNRFHDPEDDSPEIVRLRELQQLMDRAVLDAYGWTDIQPRCEFIPEFEDEEEGEENDSSTKVKYRYRWPDEIRDDVLARLLELNRQRALEEGQVILDDTETSPDAKLKKTKSKKPKAKKAKQDSAPGQITMNLGEA